MLSLLLSTLLLAASAPSISALPASSAGHLPASPRNNYASCSPTTYSLFTFPYGNGDLAPFISEATNVAHLKLVQGAVNNLNALSASMIGNLTAPVESYNIVTLNRLARTLLTVTGAIETHNIYFNSLAPVSAGGGDVSLASPSFTDQVVKDFGSFDALLTALDAQANLVPASGWAWLVYDTKIKSLDVTLSTDRNILDATLLPIINIDVFEHAYFIDRAQDKAAYLKALRSIYNWKYASDKFAAAVSKK